MAGRGKARTHATRPPLSPASSLSALLSPPPSQHSSLTPPPTTHLPTHPPTPLTNTSAWISWAQLEKRHSPARAVAVLQVAAARRPASSSCPAAPVLQAWALLMLQRGNALAATRLLARAVADDPARCGPVLRWAPVRAAAEAAALKQRGGG